MPERLLYYMSRDMTKPTKWVCAQQRLWSDWASSLCAQWVAKDASFLHADSEDSDQTGQMPRLIWVFAGRTLILLVLSCRGSYLVSVLPAKCDRDLLKVARHCTAPLQKPISLKTSPVWVWHILQERSLWNNEVWDDMKKDVLFYINWLY